MIDNLVFFLVLIRFKRKVFINIVLVEIVRIKKLNKIDFKFLWVSFSKNNIVSIF